MEPAINHGLVDLNTGEILKKLTGEYHIKTSGQLKHIRDTIKLNKDRQFIKVFTEDYKEAIMDLKVSSAMAASILMDYVLFQSNMLAYSNGTPLNNKSIGKILNKDSGSVTRIMNDLVKAKLFAKVKVGRTCVYYGNPFILCRGYEMDRKLLEFFKDYKTVVNSDKY